MSRCTTEPFRVTCKLVDGRVNSVDGLFFLDSILYHAWFLKYAPGVMDGTQHEENAQHFGLPLRQLPNNRYATSCGFYRQYDEKIEYWNKRPDWDSHAGFLDGDGKMKTGIGPMRAYRMPQVIRIIGNVEFYGYGTIKKVRELLSYIPAIGKKPAAGWGAVKEWTVEPWIEDWSEWSDKYGLMRPRPLDEKSGHDLSRYRVRDCAIRPPAWKTKNQRTCYIPEVRYE